MESEDNISNAIRESKYNSGIDKIYTMSVLRKGCHDSKIDRDFKKWFQCLRGLRSEFNSKFADDEKEKCDDYHLLFDNCLYENKSTNKITVFKKTIDSTKLTDLQIDNLLYEYELFLGDLAEKYKYGMPDADDDEGL
jgi:hypothetical protein